MKNKKVKRLVSTLLTICVFASLLTGCKDNGSDAGDVGETVESSETADNESEEDSDSEDGAFDPRSITEGVTLTIAVKDNARVEDFNTNKTTLLIEEALGVDLQFQTYASEDYETKLNTMVSSGEKLPDIIFNVSNTSIDAWAEEGAVTELSEWFANKDYAANLYEDCELAGVDLMQYMKNADGNMYFFPYYLQSVGGEVWEKMWIYEPWLEQLGAEMPTTTEEYYELCKLACSTDLNGNGKADEIALSGTQLGTYQDGWFDFLMTPFVYAFDENYLVLEDGQLSFAYMSDEWKEGLKYIKQFFDEGLIPLETLTQNGDQFNTLWKAEETMMLSFVYWNMDTSDAEYNLEWTHIPCLEGPEGVYQAMYMPSVPNKNNSTCITTDCENPLAAFLVCDYMCSEVISLYNRYGEQGVDWDYVADLDLDLSQYTYMYDHFEGDNMYIIKYDDASFWGSSDVQNVSYLQSGPYVLTARAIFGDITPIEPESDADRLNYEIAKMKGAAYNDCLANAREEVIDYMPLTADETNSTSDVSTAVTNYLYESTSQFLAGTKDIDAEWDNFLAEMEKIGVDSLLQTYQTAYDRVH